MNQKLKKYISAAVGVLALLLLDQYTKILALRFLKDQPAVVILKGVFELQYLENRGAAFGMMQNQRFFFLIITVVVLGIMVYLYSLTPVTRRYLPLRLCMVFLAAGAAGNFIDRFLPRYTVDSVSFASTFGDSIWSVSPSISWITDSPLWPAAWTTLFL